MTKMNENPLCDVQKIIPIYQAAVHGLVDAWADAAREDHCATLLLRFGVQEVVALGAKVEGCLWEKRHRVKSLSDRWAAP